LLACVEHAVCCHKSALQLPSYKFREICCWARLTAGSHSEPYKLNESPLGSYVVLVAASSFILQPTAQNITAELTEIPSTHQAH